MVIHCSHFNKKISVRFIEMAGFILGVEICQGAQHGTLCQLLEMECIMLWFLYQARGGQQKDRAFDGHPQYHLHEQQHHTGL